MLAWIQSLVAGLDRWRVAAERGAVAVEGMADDLEECRRLLRERLGVSPEAPVARLERHVANDRKKVGR